MSAPTKSITGGRRTPTTAASGHSTRGVARSISRAEVESVPRNTRDNAVPFRDRAEAIRAKTSKRTGTSTEPPRYSNRPARPRVIEAARKTATKHGYDRLRLKHITDEAEISHQAFYGHFANKRHAVAVATSDELGAIADLATRGSRQDEDWAERMLDDIDRTLAAKYPATDGPERWLRDRIVEAVSTEGGYGSLRIIELIKVSRLGHGEFYRRYGGKRGCLQRIYADALDEIKAEVGDDRTVSATGKEIASDPGRARLLILGCPHLPDRLEEDEGKATQSSLHELVADVAAAQLGGNPTDPHALVIAGGVLEVIRSAVISDSLERLPDELAVFESAGNEAATTLRLAA